MKAHRQPPHLNQLGCSLVAIGNAKTCSNLTILRNREKIR